ncbi:MAG: TonB-dependent receptor [Dechloromonas sp.]|nr:TonB-dependent receptor [Dechloromonas sp.]
MGNRIRPLSAALALAISSGAFGQEPAAATPVLEDIVVSATRNRSLPAVDVLGSGEIESARAATQDAASLLREVPGVSLYTAGGLSSLPAIHGLADDRLRISVDGMDFIASCPNHMNPPLSYIDPSSIAKIKVYAGITPVSVGGDSIGGSIVVDTAEPKFAAPGQGLLTQGEVGTSYRSNNNAVAAHLSATAATENFSVSYSGAGSQADNYTAARNFKTTTATGRFGHTLPLDEVGSTAYESWTHLLGLAYRNDNHLFEAKVGYQDVPKQLYPNQRMDMLGNEQTRVNLRYLGRYDWGFLEARAFHEEVDHFMDFGADKRYWYGPDSMIMGSDNGKPCTPIGNGCAAGMPMYSASKTTGANVRAEIDLGKDELLRVGALFQHYTLNDWWAASGANMSPNTFQNINDGERDRLGVFGEWEKRLSPQWLTQVGVRYEIVGTDAGMVHGYNLDSAPLTIVSEKNNQSRDAVDLNSADRSRTDHNWDLSALARYTVDETRDVEFGIARKVRSPNLYERYTWSTWTMAAVMNNFVGDGNGYIGNLDLKPETAYTASATFDWHAADRRWEARATPFITYVDDYIDAVRWDGATNTASADTAPGKYTVLKYANQSARLYGLDLSGRMPLGRTSFGEFGFKGLLNYTRGENRDTGGNLYNIMPLNAKLVLTHQSGGWNNAVEFVSVLGKHDVSDVRNEVETSGYNLTHLRASYAWQKVRVDFGVENLFDKYYQLPLGGAYTGQGKTMSITGTPWGVVVPGMGRSFYAGLNLKF